MVAFGTGLAEKYSRDSAVLEFEKGLSVFFSHGAKKRYIGQVVWPSHEMLVRGYETQRTDSFSYLTTTMKEIFRYTLADQGDELVAYAKQQVEALRTCQVPASEVVLAKSCKGRIVRTPVKTADDVDFTKDYSKPDSMVQVRVAKQRIERGLGFTTGMKVSYVVTTPANLRWRPFSGRTPKRSKPRSPTTADSTPSAWQPPWAESRKPSDGRQKTSWPATSKRVCSRFSRGRTRKPF